VKKGYAIPESNPYATASDPKLMVLFGVSELEFSKIKQRSKPEIWAYGIRNPWTFSFDRKTGDLYIADIGQNIWEEINVQPASSKGGEDYGWNRMCGVHPFPIEKEKGGNWTPSGVMPVAEYSHEKDGICVIGAGVYRGSEFPSLDGVYFVGDWGTGRFWGSTSRRGARTNRATCTSRTCSASTAPSTRTSSRGRSGRSSRPTRRPPAPRRRRCSKLRESSGAGAPRALRPPVFPNPRGSASY
jgi:hypothetical protein